MIKVHVLALCFALVGCSKSSDAPKPAPAPPAVVTSDAAAAAPDAAAEPTPAATGSADFNFDKLERAEKIDFMKKQVVPTMKKAFQDFDGKKYATFGCKTCHGKDPVGAKYKMPNPELPKLDFGALETGTQEPKIAEFMSKVVKPEMAKLLHETEYSEASPNGFGCLDCHEEKK